MAENHKGDITNSPFMISFLTNLRSKTACQVSSSKIRRQLYGSALTWFGEIELEIESGTAG